MSQTVSSTQPLTQPSTLSAEAARYVLVAAAYLSIVAGSQLGMLLLAETYLSTGRVRMTSPEAFAGMAAICLAALTVRLRSTRRFAADPAWGWLVCFLVISALGELLRFGVHFSGVSTFVSLGALYLIGRTIGRDIAHGVRVPFLPGLLCIYTIWYLWIAVFIARGDLGFYGFLPGEAGLMRLEFRRGFTATELPMYVGLQFPILVWAVLCARGVISRAWAFLLLVLAAGLLLASLSVGVFVATAIVTLVFLVARGRASLRALAWPAAIVLAVSILAVLFGQGLAGGVYDATRGKVEALLIGESSRAALYATALNDLIQNPLGMGIGRFSENFVWEGRPLGPHNNLLGIGAELGVPALVLYVGFLVTVVVRLGRVAVWRGGQTPSDLRMLVAAVLSVFLYQQTRGMLQDTWLVRETYFWVGLAFGVLSATGQEPPRAVAFADGRASSSS